jgi:hypothetical protein
MAEIYPRFRAAIEASTRLMRRTDEVIEKIFAL